MKKEYICTPESAFVSAQKFFKASTILYNLLTEELRALNNKPETISREPFVVNASFALETYLKCLHAIEKNGKFPHGHKLKTELYDTLSDTTKQNIKDNYLMILKENRLLNKLIAEKVVKSEVILSELAFEKVLGQIDKAFENWRYSYHEMPKELHNMLIELILATHLVVLKLKPELGNINKLSAIPRIKSHQFMLKEQGVYKFYFVEE